MGVHLHGEGIIADLELLSPSGETVRSFEGVTDERVGGKCCGLPEFEVTDPEPGTWTLKIFNHQEAGQLVEMQRWTLAAQSTPDPTSAWNGDGYEQAPYDVSPFAFFEDYQSAEKRDIQREFLENASVEAVTADDVRDGALSDYDHAVLIHDYVSPTERISEGVTDNQKEAVEEGAAGTKVDDYIEALDAFLEADGNLVVTDTGAYVLPELDNSLVDGSALGESAVQRQILDVARFTQKNLEHPLFDDSVREIQNQLWKVQPLGYQVSGAAPMDLVDEAAFAAAANDGVASVAGRTDGLVAAGSITPDATTDTGVHYISSLLPPATQANLHPFGLQNYTVTFLGNVMFTSALGLKQIRETGEETRAYGRTREWEVTPVDAPGATLSADGSRTVDSSVVTGDQTNEVELTVSNLSEDAVIRDQFPPEWRLVPWGEGTEVEDGVVEFREVKASEVDGNGEVTFTYLVEAPEGVQNSNAASYGPAIAKVGDETVNFAGQDDVVLVGVSV
jgi:hypothetical protein